jgi:hypothetical protein
VALRHTRHLKRRLVRPGVRSRSAE